MSSGSGSDGAALRRLEAHAGRAVGLAELDEFVRLGFGEQRLGFFAKVFYGFEADRRDEEASARAPRRVA